MYMYLVGSTYFYIVLSFWNDIYSTRILDEILMYWIWILGYVNAFM